jgi:hypothetical protein
MLKNKPAFYKVSFANRAEKRLEENKERSARDYLK